MATLRTIVKFQLLLTTLVGLIEQLSDMFACRVLNTLFCFLFVILQTMPNVEN